MLDESADLDRMYQNLGDTHFVSCDCHSGGVQNSDKRIQVESGQKFPYVLGSSQN